MDNNKLVILASERYNLKQNYKRNPDPGNKKNLYWVQDDMAKLKKKVKQDEIFLAKIILVLDDYTYLLRFKGSNFVMKSKIKFKKFSEVNVAVEQTEPSLILKLLGVKEGAPLKGGTMDLLI